MVKSDCCQAPVDTAKKSSEFYFKCTKCGKGCTVKKEIKEPVK